VLLYAGPEGLSGLREYESQLIPVLREYGGELLSASRNTAIDSGPDEIHVIQFSHQDQFEAYQKDERVQQLRTKREQYIARKVAFLTNEFH